MAHPLRHAESSAKKFGGVADDYIAIHTWFDESKSHFPDFRHRALRHHSDGIFLAERIFGIAITNSEGTQVPVRYIVEQHVKEDLGRIPNSSGLVIANPSPAVDELHLNFRRKIRSNACSALGAACMGICNRHKAKP